MRSMWNAQDRHALMCRLRRLAPNDMPRWGRMSVSAMAAHLIATLRFALGDARDGAVRPSPRVLRWAPVKYSFVYLLPFPKHAPTPRGFLPTPSGELTEQLDVVEQLLEQVVERTTNGCALPEHPFFGHLSVRAWGVLAYKHTDHHLRQFGV